MWAYAPRQQIITATCLVRSHGDVVLLRPHGAAGERDFFRSTPYYDVPRFHVRFGEDPLQMAKQRVWEYFAAADPDISLRDVRSGVVNETDHVIELILQVELREAPVARPGRLLLVDPQHLEAYTFPAVQALIRDYW